MAVALLMEFPMATQANYDKIMENLGMERYGTQDLPEGLICHVAFPAEKGWMVVDVWDSREDFDRFLQERLMSAVTRAGMPRPTVKEYPVYDLLSAVHSTEQVPMISMVA